MTNVRQTVLVVDPDTKTRTSLSRQLAASGCTVLQASDGRTALEMVRNGEIRLVVSELYLKTGESDCLIQAVRQNRLGGTRTLAHTLHAKSTDRDWAKQWGASGFLIQPTRTERLRYVVSRLLGTPGAVKSAARPAAVSRRDTLDSALGEIERGELRDTRSIVVSGAWWNGLSGAQRNGYRRRARSARVSLRSDAMMSPRFVELRGGARVAPR